MEINWAECELSFDVHDTYNKHTYNVRTVRTQNDLVKKHLGMSSEQTHQNLCEIPDSLISFNILTIISKKVTSILSSCKEKLHCSNLVVIILDHLS